MGNFNVRKWQDFRLSLLAEQAEEEAKKKEVKADTEKAVHIKVSKDKKNPNVKVYKETEQKPEKAVKSEPLHNEEIVKIGEYQFAFGCDEDDKIRVTFRSTNNFSSKVIKDLCKEIELREKKKKSQDDDKE